MKCEMRWEDCDNAATKNYRRQGSDIVLTVCASHGKDVVAMYRNASFNMWEV
jgi:hypothetical protein